MTIKLATRRLTSYTRNLYNSPQPLTRNVLCQILYRTQEISSPSSTLNISLLIVGEVADRSLQHWAVPVAVPMHSHLVSPLVGAHSWGLQYYVALSTVFYKL